MSQGAFHVYSYIDKDKRALFLDEIANEIINLGDGLIERCCLETGLPEARIIGERGRTVFQLNMFGSLVRDGSWLEASIDPAKPERQPIPKPDIRRMLIPIGPVVVFAASNFPLAFSTAGGDTASALAAGNPVIVKAHSSHPGTSTLIASAIIKAAKSNLSGKIFNVGSGKTVSVNRVVKLLGGKKIYIPKRPGEPDCTFADIKKIKKYLNWSPKISIEKGIKIIKENINYWKNAPIWTKDKIKIATKDWFKYLKK